MYRRFAVQWGNPPATHPPDQDWHGPWQCVACGKRLPKRAAIQCGECAHAWRWSWLLSLHDAWVCWRSGRTLWGMPAIPRRQRLRLRRPPKVWVCPCCAHDL